MTFQLWEITGGQGRWQDYKNTLTGEHSVKEHTPKKVWQACGDHYFVEEGNSRIVKCRKCGYGTKYILGMQRLVEGKIVKV